MRGVGAFVQIAGYGEGRYQPRNGKQTVMVIVVATPDAPFRSQLRQWLLDHGETCLEAESGEEVFSHVRRAQPELIVLDLYLQQPEGLDVLRELRTEGYTGKIILLGGQTVESLTPEAFRLGALQIHGRPLEMEKVIGALRVAWGELDFACED